MKVALLITKSETGGAQSHVLELIDGLVSAGHQPLLATGDEGWLTEQARSKGLIVRIIPDLVHPISPIRDLRAIIQVRKWLRDASPDLLHAHSSKAGLVGRIAARFADTPAVFTAHGWAFTEGVSMLRKMIAIPSEWLAARMGGDIICVSEYDRKLALKYEIATEGRLYTVWNGIDDVVERGKHDVQRNEPIITMVARFAPPKDHETLLRALSALSDIPWRLRLVGDGPLFEEVKLLAQSLGLERRIDFLGIRTDVNTLLASSDIFVLTSWFEGLPISILEAMRAALPIVASNVGGVSELVDAESGILVPAGDQDNLSSALSVLLSEPSTRARMGANGRLRYEKDFRASAMIEKTLSIYEARIERSRRIV